jgi:predicted RNA-binding protein with PUA-like domain
MEKGYRMRFWLLKTEADEFGWHDQVAAGAAGAEWHGIRNYQARNNLREMALGDLAFFYHTGREKAVVGIVEITRIAASDSTTDDPRWDSVWVRAARELKPVTLAQFKSMPQLKNMVLLTSPRLSVQPVTAEEWQIILALGENGA